MWGEDSIHVQVKQPIIKNCRLSDEGFKRPWPPLIKMDEAVKAKVEKLFNPEQPT